MVDPLAVPQRRELPLLSATLDFSPSLPKTRRSPPLREYMPPRPQPTSVILVYITVDYPRRSVHATLPDHFARAERISEYTFALFKRAESGALYETSSSTSSHRTCVAGHQSPLLLVFPPRRTQYPPPRARTHIHSAHTPQTALVQRRCCTPSARGAPDFCRIKPASCERSASSRDRTLF